MRKIIQLVYCLLAFFLLYGWTISSIPDDKDPVKSKKVKKQETVVVNIADSDSDNVPDSEDECPNIPGPKATKGCPDSDGDGIPDHLDGCPTIAGLAQFRGCPDSDLDGIPDNRDVCPYDAGPASNNGCPLLERKDDGESNRGTKVIDTINLDEERDLQIMRYERYIAEQELKQQEYISRLTSRMTNDNQANATAVVIAETDRKVPTGSIQNNNDEEAKKEVAPVAVTTTAPPANPVIALSTVKIDNAMYSSFKPKIEALLKNMRFQDGRVRFVDENKFFDALVELASYYKAYPEWTMTFHCFSNETDNAFGNKQLFSNRVYTLKQILVNDLNIPADKLRFTNDISNSSEVSNFISLEIAVK
jgi:hypothetical protein